MTDQALALNTAQQEFDAKYITASEVMRTLGISRATLAYARAHKLPEPIIANDGNLFIWEREAVKPFLDAWKLALTARRGF